MGTAHSYTSTFDHTPSSKPRLLKENAIGLESTNFRRHHLSKHPAALIKESCTMLLVVSAPRSGYADPAVWSANDLPLASPATKRFYGLLYRASIRLIRPSASSWLSTLVPTYNTPAELRHHIAILAFDHKTWDGDDRQASPPKLVMSCLDGHKAIRSSRLRYIWQYGWRRYHIRRRLSRHARVSATVFGRVSVGKEAIGGSLPSPR